MTQQQPRGDTPGRREFDALARRMDRLDRDGISAKVTRMQDQIFQMRGDIAAIRAEHRESQREREQLRRWVVSSVVVPTLAALLGAGAAVAAAVLIH